jgi:putative colanic acid biosynthesis glycosyltransferase
MQFSVITVCWNDLSGLKLTYNSLYSQTYEDFEWVVVDGNSTDGTQEWLQQLNADKLSWSSEPDKGIFDAMNKGISKAKGDYLIFLNSFDELAEKDILERVHKRINESTSKLEFVYGDSIDITSQGTPLYRKSKDFKTLWRGMFTQHQSMFFINNPSITYSDDYKLTADYAYIGTYLKDLKDEAVAYIDAPVCKFKLGGTNELSRYRALKEDLHIRRNVFGLNWFLSYSLYLMHFIHTTMKRLMPNAARSLRYTKNSNSN